jgi:hypothetical protein
MSTWMILRGEGEEEKLTLLYAGETRDLPMAR